MELNYTRREKIAGVFVISVVVLLVTVLVMIGRGKEWFKNFIPYYTTFDESYNLQEGAAVKMFKAEIGKVKKISIQQDRVMVELNIVEEFAPRITMGSKVIVESVTFLGSEYISLKPGPKGAARIPRSGLIPSDDYKSLADVINEYQLAKTAGMLVQAIEDLSGLVAELRSPEGQFFRVLNGVEQAAANVEDITTDLQAGRGTAGALLKSDALLAELRDSLNQAGAILDHIARASKKAPAEMDRLGNILDQIEQASLKAPATVEDVQGSVKTFQHVGDEIGAGIVQIRRLIGELEKSLDSFNTILVNVEKGSFDVPKITKSSRKGIAEARDGIEDLNKVIKALQKNFLIRGNIPADPKGAPTDAGLRK